MKTRIALLVVLLFTLPRVVILGQTTTTLKPGGTAGKDAWVTSYPGNESTNYSLSPDIAAVSWTSSSIPFDSRSYIRFDLSAIPTSATVISANLNLYHNPTSGHAQGHQGSNASFLSRVLSTWDETTVTWNNQPQVATSGMVALPATTNSSQDFLNINVTTDIQDMVTNPANNYGFQFALQTEALYRSVVFASSDHADPARWPELVIVWSDTGLVDPEKCVDILPNSTTGIDAFVTTYPGNENSNFGNSQDIAAVAWTSGDSFISRSYFWYDLAAVPPGSNLTSATLSLKYNPTSGHAQGHQSATGSNECLIRKVTAPWSETTITWNNQPTFSSAFQATVAQSTSSSQNYPAIDILGLVQDAVANPTTYFGFQLALVTEGKFRSMVFASTDNPNASLYPSMHICYNTPATSASPPTAQGPDWMILPNPSEGRFEIRWPNALDINYEWQITSIDGKLWEEGTVSGQTIRDGKFSLDLRGKCADGVYTLSLLSSEGALISTHLVLQGN